ncbi:MAG: SHOCT domain-containing protein [Clostridiaceae bacterium]
MMYWSYSMMAGWFFMMVLPLIIFTVLIFIVVDIFIHKNRASFSERYDTSLEILKERLAKGEISEEEYKSKRNLIK